MKRKTDQTKDRPNERQTKRKTDKMIRLFAMRSETFVLVTRQNAKFTQNESEEEPEEKQSPKGI